jgi:hypothetical protein
MQNTFRVFSVVCGYLLNRYFKKLLCLELILPIQNDEEPKEFGAILILFENFFQF